MGFLGSIGHAVTGILKGIGHVFTTGIIGKVLGGIGKALNSKWGKAILIAAAVFTAGVALVAGFSAFAASSGGFVDAFMAGGHAFVAALAHPILATEGMFGAGAGAGTGAAAAGEGAAAAGATDTAAAAGANAAATEGAMVGAGGATAETADLGAAAAGNVANASTIGTGIGAGAVAPTAAAAPAATSTLGGLGKGVLDFAKSTGGGLLLGNAIQGYGAGAAQEELLKKQAEALQLPNQQWAPGAPGVANLNNAAGQPINAPSGYLTRAKLVSDFLAGRSPNIAPTIGGPTSTPGQVANLAVAPGQAVAGTAPGGVLQTG